MIKRWISFLFVAGAVTSSVGQVNPVQTQPSPYPGYANTNQIGAGGLAFSSPSGQTFTPEELAAQIRNLRSVIDQTLPALTAFNEHYSNSVTAGKQTVAGTLSGLVTDALRRNQAGGQNYGAQQSSGAATNLLSVLHGLLNTNTSGAVGAGPSNLQDLIALQNALQPVQVILQRLNVSPNSNQPSPPANLAPTGR